MGRKKTLKISDLRLERPADGQRVMFWRKGVDSKTLRAYVYSLGEKRELVGILRKVPQNLSAGKKQSMQGFVEKLVERDGLVVYPVAHAPNGFDVKKPFKG